MTGPYLTTEILETNMHQNYGSDSKHYKRRQKKLPQMTNMKILLKHTMRRHQSVSQQNLELNIESLGKRQRLEKNVHT